MSATRFARRELPLAEMPVRSAEPAEPAPDEGPPAGENRRTILYIGDDLSNLRLVEAILARRSGIELLPAMQGTLGLELARQHRPDFVLLDLDLPDLSGVEVLQRLRSEPATSAVPVIVVSAAVSHAEIDRMLAAGASAT